MVRRLRDDARFFDDRLRQTLQLLHGPARTYYGLERSVGCIIIPFYCERTHHRQQKQRCHTTTQDGLKRTRMQ